MRWTASILLILSAMGGAAANEPVLLNPGEQILETFVVPGPIVRIPLPSEAPLQQQQFRTGPPPVEIDRVTKRYRNQSGWSGNTGLPAATACYPAGAC